MQINNIQDKLNEIFNALKLIEHNFQKGKLS